MKGCEVTLSFNYKILNLILFPVVLTVAALNYETWSHPNGSARVAVQKPVARLENPSKTEVLAVKEESKSVQSYSIIAEKNIFNPERKDFLSLGLNSAEQPRQIARPQMILSGVVISDDYQSASVTSPGRPLKKGERETMTLKPGDRIGEYKLAKIEADRIIMKAAWDSFEILLYDPKKPKARVEVKTAGVESSEVKGAPSVPAAPPKVDPAMAESTEKPVEPTQERVITHASPLANKDILISRSMRSAAISQAIRASNRQNTGIVGSTTGNRDESFPLGKTEPR